MPVKLPSITIRARPVFLRHGLSVFFKSGRGVFHTYSTYARGVEHLVDVNSLLEATPFGRQQDWEGSPKG